MYTYSVRTLAYNFVFDVFFCSQIVAKVECFGSFDCCFTTLRRGHSKKAEVPQLAENYGTSESFYCSYLIVSRALQVEMEGVEPSSKHGTSLLSTRLALLNCRQWHMDKATYTTRSLLSCRRKRKTLHWPTPIYQHHRIGPLRDQSIRVMSRCHLCVAIKL